jgi:3-oxoadipate enol-lactonase/4-carboxymuconolactone decarboxylase
MAFMTTDDGVRLFYRVEGPEGAPAVVFSNSLGTDHMMWQAQAEALLPAFRVVRYDQRGHGASDAPAGPYTLDRLGRDVLALADHLGLGRFSFCGVSMGGLTGQWLGIHGSERIDKLVLCATSASFLSRAVWDERIRLVTEKGLGPIVDATMERWFTAPFRRAARITIDAFRRTFLATPAQGYAGCAMALRDSDLRGELSRISPPMLVIAGRHDPAAPPEQNAEIAKAARDGRLVVLDAAHIVNVEQAEAFTRELKAFLGQPTLPHDQRFASGMARRRQVLGDAWVDASIVKRNAVNADFQDLITRYAWGEIWTRPGLEEEVRRLLVLAITASLGRWEEFDLHTRAALAAGLPVEKVKEALLQIAVYAGVPAANTAFNRLAKLIDSVQS